MKRSIVISAVTAVTLAAGGSAAAFAGGADTGRSASAQAPHTSSVQLEGRGEDAREAKAAKLTAPEAAAAAHKAVSGTVTGLDLDNDRQGLVWEADVVKKGTEHEVVLDAGTGKVLTQHEDRDSDDAKLPSGTKVSAADAARKAASHGTVTSVGLEDNGGWEVETTDKQHHEHDLAVDPHSGKVTQLPSDDDDEGDDD